MVRTKADRVPMKAVGSKAPSKIAATAPVTPSKKTGGKAKSYSGGNPYHPRETPEWQKPITNFLNPDSVYSKPTPSTPPKRDKPSTGADVKAQEMSDEE